MPYGMMVGCDIEWATGLDGATMAVRGNGEASGYRAPQGGSHYRAPQPPSQPGYQPYQQGQAYQSYGTYQQGQVYQQDPFADPYADPYAAQSQGAYGYGQQQAAASPYGAYQQGQPYQQGQVQQTQARPAGRRYANAPSGYAHVSDPAQGYQRMGGSRYAQQPPQPPRGGKGSGSSGRRKKGGKGSVIAAVLLLVVGVGLLVAALLMFLHNQGEYQVGIDEYTELSSANVTEDAVSGRPVVDFEALQLQNPEIVGWIQIPGTPINYPVCQHSDNEYYLEHTFLDQFNLAGTVFMDYRSAADLSGRNTVMYGHHLQNGEMFARIADYSSQSEFDTIENIYYVSPDGEVHVLSPLCCMVVTGTDVDSIQFDFADDASFSSYVQSLIDRSSARAQNATSAGISHIYMLSTCSYEHENDRTILVCAEQSELHGVVADATQSISEIQAAADEAAGIAG